MEQIILNVLNLTEHETILALLWIILLSNYLYMALKYLLKPKQTRSIEFHYVGEKEPELKGSKND